MAKINIKDKRMAVVLIGKTDIWNRQRLEHHFAVLKKKGIRAIYYGAVDETAKFLIFKAADTLTQPSNTDSFGHVYLEA